MLVTILSPQQLGLLIRATRRTQKLRLDDTAGTAGVGHVFVREVERGKPTVQLGRVLRLLGELGIDHVGQLKFIERQHADHLHEPRRQNLLLGYFKV